MCRTRISSYFKLHKTGQIVIGHTLMETPMVVLQMEA